MKITLMTVGKTTTGYLKQGIDEYMRRLSHYVQCDIQCIGDVKNTRNLTEQQQKLAEGKALLDAINATDWVTLLDERGSEFTSVDFSQYVQRRMSSGLRRLVFVVGGPYGFSPEVYARANDRLSLGRMTLPHELVRLVFVEQLYRAFTILRHEPYHHQ